jgi:hypothetical protein
MERYLTEAQAEAAEKHAEEAAALRKQLKELFAEKAEEIETVRHMRISAWGVMCRETVLGDCASPSIVPWELCLGTDLP